jgi:hypothetical protein
MKVEEIEDISIRVSEGLWTAPPVSFLHRLTHKIRRLVGRYLPKSSTPEIQFKTTLALLLAQEPLCTFLLGENQRDHFLSVLAKAAEACGFETFSLPDSTDAMYIARTLTHLSSHKLSLLDDPVQLALYKASLSQEVRQAILCHIFDNIERPAIHSVIEIKKNEMTRSIAITTHYARYKILNSSQEHIYYAYQPNHATSSIRTTQNAFPDGKGAINQRVVHSTDTNTWIGSYCGELSTPFHVLEQILLIAGLTNGEASITTQAPLDTPIQPLPIFFTSLYSWHELTAILDEQAAIRTWDQKFLSSEGHHYQLNLLYYNIPFSFSSRLPTPAEIKATLQDINDEARIALTASFLQYLDLVIQPFYKIASRCLTLRTLQNQDFLEKEKALLEEIDAFRMLNPQLMTQLKRLPLTPLVTAFLDLNRPHLKGMERLLTLDYVVKSLGFFHNKNSRNAINRIAGADAADKAGYAFQHLQKRPFLPLQEKLNNEKTLFTELYRLYLLKEEPEINAAFSSGFCQPVRHNFETRRFLKKYL